MPEYKVTLTSYILAADPTKAVNRMIGRTEFTNTSNFPQVTVKNMDTGEETTMDFNWPENEDDSQPIVFTDMTDLRRWKPGKTE
jgi:hypothetical protein